MIWQPTGPLVKTVTYRLPRGRAITYSSATESKLKLIITTCWHYPLWLLKEIANHD
jgi:hypothetical protein